jgi:tetratricopeptide (TPR) repeat protein
MAEPKNIVIDEADRSAKPAHGKRRPNSRAAKTQGKDRPNDAQSTDGTHAPTPASGLAPRLISSAEALRIALRYTVERPLLPIVVAVFAIVGFAQWQSTTATIDDFEISPALSKDGLTPSVISHALDAKLKSIQAIAATSMPLTALSLEKPPPLTIPGTEVSLGYVIEQAKRLFARNQLRVSGAIVTLNNGTQTVVRVNISGDQNQSYTDTYDENSSSKCGSQQLNSSSREPDNHHILDNEISCAAEFILKQAQPYILAAYYEEIGAFDAAKDLARSILFHPPRANHYWALNLLGSIARQDAKKNYIKQEMRVSLRKEAANHFDEAETIFTEVKKSQSGLKFPLTFVNRGLLYWDQNNLAKAEEQFTAAKTEDPLYGPAYSNLGALLTQRALNATGNAEKNRLWTDAMKAYQDGLHNTRDHYQIASLMTGWARALSGHDEQDEALKKIDLAIAADPGFADAYRAKGEILQRLSNGASEIALEAFTAAANLKPWDLAYGRAHATALQEAGRIDESVKELRSLTERFPRDIDTRLQLGRSLGDKADSFREAMDQYFTAYSDLMHEQPGDNSKDTIERNVSELARRYVTAPTTEPQAQRELIIQKANAYLGAGFAPFADRLYRIAVDTEASPDRDKVNADALSNKIVDAFKTAVKAASPDDRVKIIDLALAYRSDDKTLMKLKLMNLVSLKRIPEATEFAKQNCGGDHPEFNSEVRKWLGDVKCPD